MRTLAVATFLFAAAGVCQAAELIFLKDGTVVKGEVTASTETSVTAVVGGTTYTVSADKFDPHFFYRVRDKALGNDAAGRIQLAKYAVMNDMFTRAKAQVDQAEAIDPEFVKKFRAEAERLRKSIAAPPTSIACVETACTASVWNRAPWASHIAPISRRGWSVPISLLAAMIETRAGPCATNRSSVSRSSRPSWSTATNSSCMPRARNAAAGSRTLGCSMADTTRRVTPAVAPRSTRLFASVAPDAKTISEGRAPISAATLARASSMASAARQPARWSL